eukprot:scaffold35166_cov50-Attheya_sp.AAC.3
MCEPAVSAGDHFPAKVDGNENSDQISLGAAAPLSPLEETNDERENSSSIVTMMGEPASWNEDSRAVIRKIRSSLEESTRILPTQEEETHDSGDSGRTLIIATTCGYCTVADDPSPGPQRIERWQLFYRPLPSNNGDYRNIRPRRVAQLVQESSSSHNAGGSHIMVPPTASDMSSLSFSSLVVDSLSNSLNIMANQTHDEMPPQDIILDILRRLEFGEMCNRAIESKKLPAAENRECPGPSTLVSRQGIHIPLDDLIHDITRQRVQDDNGARNDAIEILKQLSHSSSLVSGIGSSNYASEWNVEIFTEERNQNEASRDTSLCHIARELVEKCVSVSSLEKTNKPVLPDDFQKSIPHTNVFTPPPPLVMSNVECTSSQTGSRSSELLSVDESGVESSYHSDASSQARKKDDDKNSKMVETKTASVGMMETSNVERLEKKRKADMLGDQEQTLIKVTTKGESLDDAKDEMVQLFASDFSSELDPNLHGSSKRKIKSVVRFDATPLSAQHQKKIQEAEGKIGLGFQCPQCSAKCLYNVRQCASCKLDCRYVPGTGVVVFRDRTDVSKSTAPAAPISSNEEKKNGVKVCPPRAAKSKEKKKNKAIVVEAGRQLRTRKRSDTDQERPLSEKATSCEDSSSFSTVDCEVCLQPFSSIYIFKHRAATHKLKRDQFGCPYCSKVFQNTTNRHEHIESMHPGLPSERSDEEKNKNKPLVYECNLCGKETVFFGMKLHLHLVHGIDQGDAITREESISCRCPFCPGSKTKFNSGDSLRRHVSKKHPGCSLLEKCPSRSKKSKRSKKVSDIKNEKPVKGKNGDSSILAEAPSNDDKKSSLSLPLHWEKLDHGFLLYHHDFSITGANDSEKSIDGAMELVNSHYSLLGKKNDDIKSHFSKESLLFVTRYEREYMDESRIYKQGLQRRQRKAEFERIEKENYKADCKEKLLIQEYENRTKKRSSEEIEHDAFLLREVKIAKKDGGDIHNALPLPVEGVEDSKVMVEKIYVPEFCEISPYFFEENTSSCEEPEPISGEGCEKSETKLSRSEKRYADKYDEQEEQIHNLSETFYTLQFIQRYNEGYLRHDVKSRNKQY